MKFMAVGVFGAVVDFGIMNLFSKLFGLALVWAFWTPLAALAGSGWLPVGMPGFSAVSTHHIRLALDSSNIPYVAFQDAITGYGSGTVMKYN